MKSKDKSRWFFFLFGSFHELFWFQTCLLIVSHVLSWMNGFLILPKPTSHTHLSKQNKDQEVCCSSDIGWSRFAPKIQVTTNLFQATNGASPLSHYFCFWKWNFNLSWPMTFSAMGACSWWFFCCSLVSFVTRVDFFDDYGWSLMELCILNDFCIGYLGIHGQFKALDILMVHMILGWKLSCDLFTI